MLAPEITVSALLDRTRTQAWGLFGGLPGSSGGLLVKRKDDPEFRTFSEAFGTVSSSKFTRIVLREGDEVILRSPGGGGYGPPAERNPAAVDEDIRQGYVTRAPVPSAGAAGLTPAKSAGDALGDKKPHLPRDVGHWEELHTQWHEMEMIYCSVCGLILPKRLWVVESDGKRIVFCGPGCEHLYHDYVQPGKA